jgi:dihydrofolate reductase
VRKLVVHMQTTLDNRIARADGSFWEPFAWGDEEQAWINDAFRAADTWVMGRHVYEAVVPWWEAVARGDLPTDLPEPSPADEAFAALLVELRKLVISRTLAAAPGREVIAGDVAAALRALKAEDGRSIVLSCGPSLLGPLAAEPGLVDEYLLVVHPAILEDGPRLFGEAGPPLALRLAQARAFAGGAIILRYVVVGPRVWTPFPVDPSAPPSGTGCFDCLAEGGWWFSLRRCAACGRIGCCDASVGQHARRHADDAGHPVVRSFEPGDDWFWDYVEDQPLDGVPELAPPLSRPVDQPKPGPPGSVPPNWRELLRD